MTKEQFKLYMQMLDEAYDHFCKAILAFKRAQIVIVFVLLYTVISAQSFEKINGLGKKESEIITMINSFAFHKGTNKIDGNRIDFYHSNEFGLVGYIFNKDNICIKVALPIVSSHFYDVSDFITTKIKNTNITLITKNYGQFQRIH
jgi:hypothetical protein